MIKSIRRCRSIAARRVSSRRGRLSIHIHSSTALSSKCEQCSGGDPGGPGGQRTPTFLSGGSRIRLWPPVLTPCWCHFFRFIYWLWTETVVVDQVLLWFRPTLILSRIPDYNIIFSLLHLDGWWLQRPLVIYKCFKYLLTKLSNNIDVFVIFKWSLTLAIFETIVETTQAIL